MIKKPIILLLDEATAALDSSNESVVQQTIEKLISSKSLQTVISVAHRLSTIRQADKIFMIYQGQVAESGSHDELITMNGLYADLVRSQLVDTPLDEKENLQSNKLSSSRAIDDSELVRQMSGSMQRVHSLLSFDDSVHEEGSSLTRIKTFCSFTSDAVDEELQDVDDDDKDINAYTRSLLLSFPTYLFVGVVGALMIGSAYPCESMRMIGMLLLISPFIQCSLTA
jgi:ABC-type multidrug transport system ATPase subunit